MFCPKCKSLLRPKEVQGQKILACGCGYQSEGVVTLSEKQKQEVQKFEAVEDKEMLPLIEALCKKCNHMKAYYWVVQTRAADEPPTRFYRCEKCKHTWREYK